MESSAPSWEPQRLLSFAEGLKIFNFHPVHIYLNSSSMDSYRKFKQRAPSFTGASPAEAEGFIMREDGARHMFLQILDHLRGDHQSAQIKDIVSRVT